MTPKKELLYALVNLRQILYSYECGESDSNELRSRYWLAIERVKSAGYAPDRFEYIANEYMIVNDRMKTNKAHIITVGECINNICDIVNMKATYNKLGVTKQDKILLRNVKSKIFNVPVAENKSILHFFSSLFTKVVDAIYEPQQITSINAYTNILDAEPTDDVPDNNKKRRHSKKIINFLTVGIL